MKSLAAPPKDLPALARQAHASCGLTQEQAARHLGVSASAYEQALSGQSGLDVLRRRITAVFTAYRVEGPLQRAMTRDPSAVGAWEDEGGAGAPGPASPPGPSPA